MRRGSHYDHWDNWRQTDLKLTFLLPQLLKNVRIIMFNRTKNLGCCGLMTPGLPELCCCTGFIKHCDTFISFYPAIQPLLLLTGIINVNF